MTDEGYLIPEKHRKLVFRRKRMSPQMRKRVRTVLLTIFVFLLIVALEQWLETRAPWVLD